MRTFVSRFQIPLRSLLGTQISLFILVGGCLGQSATEATNSAMDDYRDIVSVEFQMIDRHIADDVHPVPSEFNTELGSVNYEDPNLLFDASINTEVTEGFFLIFPNLSFGSKSPNLQFQANASNSRPAPFR